MHFSKIHLCYIRNFHTFLFINTTTNHNIFYVTTQLIYTSTFHQKAGLKISAHNLEKYITQSWKLFHVCLSVYQVLKSANEGGTQTSLVKVFSVAQVDDLMNQL